MAPTTLHCMSYNIGGGRRDQGRDLAACVAVIRAHDPALLALQEASSVQDGEGAWHSDALTIAAALDYPHVAFAPCLSMQRDLHIGKKNMVRALFADQQEWQMGNALLSRLPFVGWGEPTRAGPARSIPLFRAPRYEGTRDTEPRDVLLARLALPPHYPFVATTHLTTLNRERGPHAEAERATQAIALRRAQGQSLLALLAEVRTRRQPLILLGDLNATPGEGILQELEAAGFTRLCPSGEGGATHQAYGLALDHILCFPAEAVAAYQCAVIDTPLSRQASDHLPIHATITWR